ncbi:MAG: hypothetical protein ABIH18_03070 [Candidatus Omnitrophota bacterium]
MKKKILYILYSFLAFISLNSHICFAREDNFAAAKKLESIHFTVFYAPELEAQQLAKQLNISMEEKFITGHKFSEENLAQKLDILFEQICNILDMRLLSYKGNIKICRDEQKLIEIYRNLFDKDLGGMRSFYVDSFNTIYISADSFCKEILGHEIAHAVISHYFVVLPSVKIQEVLAGYVEYQLRKTAK